MTDTEPATAEDHLAKAAQLAAYATETNHAGYAPSALAYATTAQVHATLAQVLTAREALASHHGDVGAEPVPGATLARIHEALADDARPP